MKKRDNKKTAQAPEPADGITPMVQKEGSKLKWFLVGWCVIIGAIRFGGPNETLLSVCSWADYFEHLSGALAMSQGLHCFSDFSSPFGPLHFEPFRMCAALVGWNPYVMKLEQTLLFVAISVISFLLFRKRFEPFTVCLLVIYFSLSCCCPAMSGGSPFIPYEGLSHDWTCAALGGIAVLVTVCQRSKWDVWVVGVLCAYEVWVKPNFGLTDTMFVVILACITRRPLVPFLTQLAGIVIVFSIGVIAIFHVDLHALWGDLLISAKARSAEYARGHAYFGCEAAHGIGSLHAKIVADIWDAGIELCPLVLAGCFMVQRADKGWQRAVAILGTLFCLSVAREFQNTFSLNLGFIWVVLLCFPTGISRWVPRAMVALYCIPLSIAIGYNCYVSIFTHDDHPEIVGNFRHLHIMAGDADASGFPFSVRMNSAMELLSANGLSNAPVAMIDCEDQIPVLLDSPWPVGQSFFTGWGDTVSDEAHVPPERFFRGAAAILNPFFSCNPVSHGGMAQAYAPYIQTNFVQVANNRCWQLFRRKNATDSPDYQAKVVADLQAKAGSGDAAAQLDLAKHLLSGQGVAVSSTNAFQWFSLAAAQGLAEAQCQLGMCYLQGIGTTNDLAASMSWFRKAADKGYMDAQYDVGWLYENGVGVTQDMAEAAIWYQRAGEHGHVLAQNSLGMFSFNQKKDYAAAVKWFGKAADQGNAPAQNSLGVMYLQGVGVKQDANEAFKWFQRAGQQGFAEAQNNCGTILSSSQRFNEAAQWFHQAADQGHPGAQFNLAQFYEKGLVYTQDLAQATLWYTKAANQNNGPAQFALGKMYFGGQGGKTDLVEAYKWYKLAQLQGVADAEKELASCRSAMTIEQIKTAEDAVRQMQKPK